MGTGKSKMKKIEITTNGGVLSVGDKTKIIPLILKMLTVNEEVLSVGDKTEIISLILNILQKYDPLKPKTVVLIKSNPSNEITLQKIIRQLEGGISHPNRNIFMALFIVTIAECSEINMSSLIPVFGYKLDFGESAQESDALSPIRNQIIQKYNNFYLPQKNSEDHKLTSNFLTTQLIEFISEIFPDTNFILI